MNAKITFINGPHAGHSYNLPDSPWRIGRAHACDLRIQDEEISGRHLQLGKLQDGNYYLEDLGSTNGTLLNGTPLPKSTKRILQVGDQVIMGVSTFVFHDAVSAQPLSSTAQFDTHTPMAHQVKLPDSTSIRITPTIAPDPKSSLLGDDSAGGNTTSLPNAFPLNGYDRSQITNLTEFDGAFGQEKAQGDPDMTLVGGSVPSVRARVQGVPAERVRNLAPRPRLLSLLAGLFILLLIVLSAMYQACPKNKDEIDTGPFEYSTDDFTATRPKYWQATRTDNSVYMSSRDKKQSVLILTKRDQIFYYAPIWNNPSLLKEFLRKNELLTASVTRQLAITDSLPLSNLDLIDWNGGIKGIAFEMIPKRGNALYGQLVLTHDAAIVFLAAYPVEEACSRKSSLANLAAWIKLRPPLNSSLYTRPSLEFSPFNGIEKSHQACNELSDISSIVDNALDQSKYAEAIGYYQLAFSKLSAAGVGLQTDEQNEKIGRHIDNFISVLEKRRNYLRKLQGLILTEEAKGNRSVAIREAENLYSEAGITHEYYFMEWSWKKLKELQSVTGKKSSNFP